MHKITIHYGFPDAGETESLDIYTDKPIGMVEEDSEDIAIKRLEQKGGLKGFKPRWAIITKVKKIDGIVYWT